MERVEKTVFICYRRTSVAWALAIYQYLTARGYDVFIDYLTIPAGDFEQVIVENIKGRARVSGVESSQGSGDISGRDARRHEVVLYLDGQGVGRVP